MITKILKSAVSFFNAVNSEVEYWKQIENLQTELEKTIKALSVATENEEYLRIDNLKLMAENNALKEEVQLGKDCYTSLLKDYYSMTDKHREYKRQNHKVIADLRPLYRVVDNSVLESLGEKSNVV